MQKTHLIFLHGALGCQLHWHKISSHFENEYVVHTPDFPGHGMSEIDAFDSTFLNLTHWLGSYLKQHQIERYGIIGYSMGGYIGLSHLVNANAENCQFLITLATKLNWNQAIAAEENAKLNLKQLAPILSKIETEHPNNTVENLLIQTQSILSSIGENPLVASQFSNNKTPIFMLLGSKDKMINEQEILAFQSGAHAIQFQIIDQQPHLLERMDAMVISDCIQQILKTKIN